MALVSQKNPVLILREFLVYVVLTSLFCFPSFPCSCPAWASWNELVEAFSISKIYDLSSKTKFDLVLFKINSHEAPCSYVSEASSFLVWAVLERVHFASLYLDVIGDVFFCFFLVVLVVSNALVVILKLCDEDNRGPREGFSRPRYHLAHSCTIFPCYLCMEI